MTNPQSMPESTPDTVIVAGFGGAGAAAAVAAAHAGARVIVFDRAPEELRGGNSRANLFYMLLKENLELADNFIPELDDMTVPRAFELGPTPVADEAWGLDSGMRRVWLEEAGGAVEWLRSFGLEMDFEQSDIVAPGTMPGVKPQGGGEGMLNVLEQVARDRGAEFIYETAVIGVETDKWGVITGVMVEGPEGRYSISCSALILATGGFHGNLEMMNRYLGPGSRNLVPLSREGYFNKGEGVRIGIELGAATAGDMADFHGVSIDARADGERWLTTGSRYGILVNHHGKRFVNETGGEHTHKAVRDQEHGYAFSIVDQKIINKPFYHLIFNSEADPYRADTLEELAVKIGVPADALRATVDEYNAACDPSVPDGSAGARGIEFEKTRLATPLTDGPFEAWPVRSGICFGLGGLKVDEDGRVLSLDNRPIEGLYAVGDTAGGFFKAYPTYTSTLKALVLGRRSGAHAAQRAGSEKVVAAGVG